MLNRLCCRAYKKRRDNFAAEFTFELMANHFYTHFCFQVIIMQGCMIPLEF